MSRTTVSAHRAEVALVTNARGDSGYQIASELLRSGYRVAVTGQASQLARIMHGYSPAWVLPIAAETTDYAQLANLVSRVEKRFGHPVDVVIDAQIAYCD